jgi:hypothetical protein
VWAFVSLSAARGAKQISTPSAPARMKAMRASIIAFTPSIQASCAARRRFVPCACRRTQAFLATKLLRREKAANPSPPNPISIIAQVEGSGAATPVNENAALNGP